MLNFTRISSLYPSVVKLIENKNYQKNLTYSQLLKQVLKFGFGENDNISKELIKKNYNCNEIITNIKILQNKWSQEFLPKNKKNILIEQIAYFKTNIIYFGNYSYLSKKFVKQLKKLGHIKLIIVFHCSTLTKKAEEKLRLADIIITCTKGYKLEIEKKINKKTFLIHHAFNAPPKITLKIKERPIDISFIGSLYMKSGFHINRVNLIYDLLKKFSNTYIGVNFPIKNFYYILIFLLTHNSNFIFTDKLRLIYKVIYILINCKKAVYGKEMLQLLRKSKILINAHIENTKYAGNMRLFEGTAMGCLVLTDNKIGLGQLFKINSQIIVYKNLSDLVNKINYYLNNKKELLHIAKKGYKKTLQKHNYKNRVNILNKIIKKNINI
tara:strand:+ start:4355 stop:5500 length:1146 start_codon:yes stop_codon:yes gene_type:complete